MCADAVSAEIVRALEPIVAHGVRETFDALRCGLHTITNAIGAGGSSRRSLDAADAVLAALDGARAPVVALAVAEALDAGILRHIAARSTSRAVLIVDALGEFAGELGELCQLGSRRLCTVEAQLQRPHDNLSAAKGREELPVIGGEGMANRALEGVQLALRCPGAGDIMVVEPLGEPLQR